MNWIKNIGILVISLSLSLLVAEVFVQIFKPQNTSGSWRTIDEHGLIMNKSEGDSFQVHGERRADYYFEKFGVRSSFVTNNTPSSKVLVLGDSFTFGWLLNTEDTYIELLAQANNHISFLNAAAGGWGASDYTAYLETYCTQIKPDIALVIMNADDIGRILTSKLYTYDPDLKLVTRSQYETTSNDRVKKILNTLPFYFYLIENSHLITLARATYLGISADVRKNNVSQKPKVNTFGTKDIKSIDYSNQFSAALFQHLSKISKMCGTDLRIIYNGIQIKNNLGTYPTLEFIDFARNTKFFDELGITFIDLSNNPNVFEYRNNLSKYTIKNDGHPNESGAKLLFMAINQSGIL